MKRELACALSQLLQPTQKESCGLPKMSPIVWNAVLSIKQRALFYALRCTDCLINCLSGPEGVDAGPQEDRLISHFFYENQYHLSSRPVAVESDPIEVKFGLSLQQIIDVVS